MKANGLKFILLVLLLQLFSFSSLSAAVLVDEGFDSNINGWSVSDPSNVYHYSDSGNGWLFIDREDSAEKTFNLGSTYANQTVTVSMNWWASYDWESSPDYLQVRINNSEDHNDNNGGGYVNHTFSTTADGSGNITIYISPRTSQNSEDAYIDGITIETQDPILSCPGETIFANPLASSDTHTISDGTNIDAHDSHYYTFTPQVDGVFRAEFDADYDSRNVEMSITQGCSGSNLGSSPYTSDGDKDSGDIEVSAGNQVVVEIYRDYKNNMSYGIDFTFTAFVATANDDTFSLITNNTLSDNVLDNDKGTIIAITAHTEPANGTLNISTDGAFTYVPDTDYQGTDIFTYTIKDSNGESSIATVTISVADEDITSTGGRDFTLRHQENLFGDVVIIGNTVLCQQNSSGECVESLEGRSNADVNLTKAPESYSILTLPTNASIEYARLYWLGRTPDGWNSTTQSLAGQIKIKKDNGSYVQLTANIKDGINYNDKIFLYSASTDASSVVDGPGTYYVDTSSFYTETGDVSDGLGTSGSWALVVVYSDPDETEAKNITIFDGFTEVTSGVDTSASVTGFLTPKNGVVYSTLYTMAAEGDLYLSGTSDQIQMAGATYHTTLQDLGTFDSRIDLPATRSPELSNNNGTDIHRYNVGTANGGAGIIDTNEVGANFNFTSDQDVYYPSLFVFSTQLYLPQMCYDYSVKQDGHYLKLDRATSTRARIDGRISSSPLEIEVYLRNEEADLPAEGIAFRTDLNTTMFNQTGNIYTSNINGSVLLNRGTPLSTSPLCDYNINGDNSVGNTGCTDGHNIRKGNGTLDAYDYVYTKFILQPNTSGVSDINQSLGLSIRYYITANGSKISYPDYELGGANVPICPPSAAYVPQFGQFNVIADDGTMFNNLDTQISRKPYNVDVIFDSDPSNGRNDPPPSDLNTTVLVEVIDLDAFGDINASCANPDSNVSQPIFVPLNFTPSTWQTQVPPQTADFFNFAVKNSTYRIWYFIDNNNSLIENWSATTTNNGKSLISINGLYDSSVHTVCSAACTDQTSSACFDCIRSNYAQPLCARDNFSVRPESFDLRVYDVNNTLPSYTIDDDPTNPKNTTKQDLSTLHNQIPTQPLVNGTPIKLAADYDYRFDVNATGFDTLSAIPGYTREFSNGNNYNVTMYWDGPGGSVCNNADDQVLSFYIANGQLRNEEERHNDVGDYFINIIDRTWTAVDWDPSLMTHHDTTPTGGFENTLDCIAGSSISVTAGKHGCTVTSNQPVANGGVFRDVPVTFFPYGFNIVTSLTMGPGKQSFVNKPFVYMNDINSSDENLSVHFDTLITARGFHTNTPLSNFTGNCYAQDTNLTIGKSVTNSADIALVHRTHDLNATGDKIPNNDINGTIVAGDHLTAPFLYIPANFWDQNMSGTLSLETNLNFDRNVSNPVNPEDINFTDFQMVDSDNTEFNAELIHDKVAQGSLNVGTIVHFYYGKTVAPKVTVLCNSIPCTTGNDASNIHKTKVLIYNAIYCNPRDPGMVCSPGNTVNNNLPLDAIQTNDIRWWTNPYHDINITTGGVVPDKDGIIGTVSEVNYNKVSETNRIYSNNYTYETQLRYDGTNSLPYDAIMQMQSSPWLIFDENNESAITNKFTVEFMGNSGWSGLHEEDSTTETKIAPATNRRIMW